LQLRIVKDKVDHPRKGSKDLSDAVCGAVYNAIALTPPDADREVEIYNYSGVFAGEIEQLRRESEERLKNTIRMPEKKVMPVDIRDFFDDDDSEYKDIVDNFKIL